MRYISTRGQAPARDFAGVLLAGLAEDGGLFMPEAWPRWSPADLRGLRGLPYCELAARVLAPGGRLVVVDLAEHRRDDLTDRLAHRWPGFTDVAMQVAFDRMGLLPAVPLSVPGPLEVRLWSGVMPAPRTDAHLAEHAHQPVSEDA